MLLWFNEFGVPLALGDRGEPGASVLLSRFLSGLLFEIEPTDPVTFVAVGVVLATVALLAALISARRATRVEPIDALRVE